MTDRPAAAHEDHGDDWARFRPSVVAGVTLMQAHFTHHVFERHSHPEFAVGVTFSGVQTFHHRGAAHASLPGDVMMFNPDEAHDGQRGSADGFGYAILYVDPPALARQLDREAGVQGSLYVHRPIVHDPLLAQRLQRAMAAMGQPQETLREEALVGDVLAAMLLRYGERPAERQAPRDPGRSRLLRVRDWLQAHPERDVSIEALAQEAGLSRVHLTRAFAEWFGTPPHAYLNAVRLRRARELLLAGVSPAEAAAASGFADQSHFSRRFKGTMGLTPGQWLRQMRGSG